ncbi:MAG: Precorrin-3B methylase [Verrucomicrobiota bacterium]
MPTKKDRAKKRAPLSGTDLVKETCRRIRLARERWKDHNNKACRAEREKALALYHSLSKEQKDKIPQELRVWLRYRSEKYFGDQHAKKKRNRQ